jgi:hypothetical protein
MSKGMKEKLRARRTRRAWGVKCGIHHSSFVPQCLRARAHSMHPRLRTSLNNHLLCLQSRHCYASGSLAMYFPTHLLLMDADLEVEAPRRRRGRKTRVRYVDNWSARRTEAERERERERDTGPSSRSEGVRKAWVRLVSSCPLLPIQCASTNTKPPSVHS